MNERVDADQVAFRFLGRRLSFSWRWDLFHDARVFRFVDRTQAERFLRQLLAQPAGEQLLRQIAARAPQLNAQQLDRPLPQLVEQLLRGTLVVVEPGRQLRRPGGGPKERPPSQPPKSTPPQTQAATFIEIELVDQQGRPVPGERYVITLPNGDRRNGTLDANGRARLEGIRPGGPCDVAFPDIHSDDWDKL